MKNLKPYSLILMLTLALFASCKKDRNIPQPKEPEKIDPMEMATDSASLVIDGNTYTFNNIYVRKNSNTDAKCKVDSIVNGYQYYISGPKDLVYFGREFSFSGDKTDITLSLGFYKVYNKANAKKEGLLYYPIDRDAFFEPGERNFALDHQRENGTDGITLTIRGYGKSFSDESLGRPTTITQDKLKDARFEITNFTKLKNGTYLLEAKFAKAVVFGEQEQPKTIDKGYVRLIVTWLI
ncbi:hypothetical protein KHS38_02870 [Mucilaginibacter sp. Bleaf8]|uniref:hypothetical protein n=1 Tax=Mucilaginibacter sp. Bleaf8 TaxID=2834430 RepID=UPI001BD0864F|nr:hypothetical protein [Mucilaginibacter sp. Bleaf8]MBS7563334.1 hypothetical protein [Mucilaginibacter sp. Bleaf8]